MRPERRADEPRENMVMSAERRADEPSKNLLTSARYFGDQAKAEHSPVASPLFVLSAHTAMQRLIGWWALPRQSVQYVGQVVDGLWLQPCSSIHTFGMRQSLDLIWLDALGGVLRIDAAVGSNQIRYCRNAQGVLELQAGAAAQFDAVWGERLRFTPWAPVSSQGRQGRGWRARAAWACSRTCSGAVPPR